MWQAVWEGVFKKIGCMYMYGQVPSQSTWSYHNIVNWPHHNTKLKAKPKKKKKREREPTGNWQKDSQTTKDERKIHVESDKKER